jgi:hypothetical protein
MSDHILRQLTDRRAIILFLNALDNLPPEILRLIAGRIVAKLCPGVVQVHGVNNLSSSVLRRLSFSHKLASAAMHELPRVVTIEYDAPRLEFDLLQYSTPLVRAITWLPFPRRQLQHLSLLVPLGGSHAHYLPGMTESIAALPQIFPGLKSLELVMNWSGHFIIPGQTLADRTQWITSIQSGELCEVFVDFLAIVNALSDVKLAQKSVNDPSWANGAVSFNGSRKAAMARLLGEDLMSRAPHFSIMFMNNCRTRLLPLVLASNDEDESWLMEYND